VVAAGGYNATFSENSANNVRLQFYIDANEAALVSGYNTTPKPITFYTGGSLRATLDSSGNLGVGYSSSLFGKLSINSNGAPATSGSMSTGFTVGNGTTGTAINIGTFDAGSYNYIQSAYVNSAGTARALAFFLGSTQAMTLDASGNLGVGTTSPLGRFNASSTSGNVIVLDSLKTTSGAADTGAGIEFVVSDGSAPRTFGVIGSYKENGTSGNYASYMAFSTRTNGSAVAERARIDSSGNFLLGTTSNPGSYRMEVYGDAHFGLGSENRGIYLGPNGFTASLRYNGDGSLDIAPRSGYSIKFLSETGGTERARIDSSGNFFVGRTSTNGFTSASTYISKGLSVEWGDARFVGMPFNDGSEYFNGLFLNAATRETNIRSKSADGNDKITFSTGPTPTERARITVGGDFAIGKTSASESYTTGNGYGFAAATTDPFFSIVNVTSGGANACIYLNRRFVSSTSGLMVFLSNDGSSQTTVGVITHNGTNTTYGTSSDYRLKNSVTPMTGALAKVSLLKPCTYKWNATGADGQGFIAHELAEVFPDAVQGEKDAVDKNGDIDPQGIDTSYLVATLTAAIQELKAELDSVKSELATIKGA
jgi:hypothetical protein